MSGNKKRSYIRAFFCLWNSVHDVRWHSDIPYISAVRVTGTLAQNWVLGFSFPIQRLCSVWHVIYTNTENLNLPGVEKIFAIWIHPLIQRSITQTLRELINFNSWSTVLIVLPKNFLPGTPKTIYIPHLQVLKFHKCNIAKAGELRKAFIVLRLKQCLVVPSVPVTY